MSKTNRELKPSILVADPDQVTAGLYSVLEPLIEASITAVPDILALEETIKTKPFSLLITEMRLSGGQVSTVFDMMREHKLPSIPSLVITAWKTDPKDAQDLMRTFPNIRAVIAKPFEINEVEAQIRKALTT